MTDELLTFGQTLDYFAAQNPDEIVLQCAQLDGSITALSRHELRMQSDAIAKQLIDLGVNTGELIPIILPTSVSFLVATTAIFKAGGTPMPMSHKLTDSERDGLLALAQPKAVFSEVNCGYPSVSAYVSATDSLQTHSISVRISDPIKALASGGSTGKPKLILTSGPYTAPLGENLVGQTLRFQAGDLKYSPGPLYHNGPFWFSLNMLMSGGRVLLNERFDAERCLSLIETLRPTVLNLVPTMMQRMLRAPNWFTADLSSLRVVWHLAAPCPAWAKEGFIERLGGETVLELWAATESTGMTMLDGNEWLAHRGSVGKGVGTDILILNEERKPLPAGEVGEIFTRFAGQAANYEYLGASALETIEGDYASVGDLGWLDYDGYLYLADRRTDLIISGGANIFPAEVEAVISQHPSVKDVAVVGLSDPDLGRRVHAVVALYADKATVGGDELLALCGTHLARYKVPRSIEFVAELPRNDAGKIRRGALRDARETEA